jgi:uncharacterized membrane protein YecN with MAPEG domain
MTGSIGLAYAVTCIVLSVNLLMLWVSSGAIRAKSKIAINAEDGARYGVPVSDVDPPGVARALRAPRHPEAPNYPILLQGLGYVLGGGTAWVAVPIFAIFTIARLAHSIFYVCAMQPWRTVSFAVSLVTLLALMAAVLYVTARAN